jgi:hypothetical protein
MFLSVNADERARRSAKAERLKQSKKAIEKKQTAARKLVRERERERASKISATLKAPTPTPAPETCHPEIAAFLSSGRFFGESDFENSARIRKLCGDGRLWNAENRQWGTCCPSNIVDLLRSGLWRPVGVARCRYAALLEEIAARDKRACEAAIAARAAAAEVYERRRVVAKRARELRDAKEKRDGEAARARVAAAAAARRVPTQHRPIGKHPTPAEVDACAELGFTQAAILASGDIASLGPTPSLSLEGRLLRWIDILKYQVRCANPKCYFDEVALAPLQRDAVAAFVASCNASQRGMR